MVAVLEPNDSRWGSLIADKVGVAVPVDRRHGSTLDSLNDVLRLLTFGFGLSFKNNLLRYAISKDPHAVTPRRLGAHALRCSKQCPLPASLPLPGPPKEFEEAASTAGGASYQVNDSLFSCIDYCRPQ